MYTRAPSEVIHGRSFPAKSMICAVQLLMSKLDEFALARDRRNRDLRCAEGLIDRNNQRSCVQRTRRAQIHVGVAATKHDRIPGLGQGAVYRTLQVWRGAEIDGPKLRSEGEQPAQ